MNIEGDDYNPDDVHIHHCCASHCKYGENDCPVVSGKCVGLYECEGCTCLRFNPHAVEMAEQWWNSKSPEEKAAHFLQSQDHF